MVNRSTTFADERYMRALQTISRLMQAAELVLNASRAEGFDGHVDREAELKGFAMDLIGAAQQIVSEGEI